MLNFKKLTMSDVSLIREYILKYNKGYNNNTLGGFFAWREMLNTEFVEEENILYIRICINKKIILYYVPMGLDVDKGILNLIKYAKDNSVNLEFCLNADDDLDILGKYFEYDIKHIGRGDYIYDFNSLKTMSGRKLHGQKNHLNYFLKNNADREIIKLDSENSKELINFIEDVKNVHKEQNAYMYRDELSYNKEVIEHFDEYNYNGIMVKVNAKIAGFVLGERIKDTIFLHIMKIDKNYRGVAQFLITEYLKLYDDDVKYINMEDDAGDEDLIYTKECYHPIKIQDLDTAIITKYKV